MRAKLRIKRMAASTRCGRMLTDSLTGSIRPSGTRWELMCKVCHFADAVILSNLISRSDEQRYTAKTFQTLAYFNSMLVSILKFMERDSFSARSKQEKVQFLRGLLKVLPQFSPALQRRKLLPSVRESINADGGNHVGPFAPSVYPAQRLFDGKQHLYVPTLTQRLWNLGRVCFPA